MLLLLLLTRRSASELADDVALLATLEHAFSSMFRK